MLKYLEKMINFLFVYFYSEAAGVDFKVVAKALEFSKHKCCKFIYLQYMVKRKRCGHDRLV